MPKFKLTDRVVDRGGYEGTLVLVTEWEGSVWYDVRLPGGVAVRYDSDLRLIDPAPAQEEPR